MTDRHRAHPVKGGQKGNAMNKQLEERIVRERTVDTRNYRYIIVEVHNPNEQHAEIRRIPIECIGTTAALDNGNWQLVKVIK